MTKPPPVFRLDDDIFGWIVLREAWPAVYGEQLPTMIYERFDRDGRCVERREVPSAVRIVYPPADV
jgi:hypothetical protein